MKLKFLKLRFLKLMLLLFILPLQMLAAELGEAGKLLATLPGVSDVETLKSTHFPEKYVFFIKQQLDAKDASKGSFEQRVILCHRGFDRPTVLVTEGYNAKYALREGYIEELSKLFDTNIITVEYRYFDKSMPSPCNWDYLTVENSLYDLHHVNQTLHAMYKVRSVGGQICVSAANGKIKTVRERYRTFFRELSQKDTTEKQAMAAAAILVADQLATGWFFRDGLGLTIDDLTDFLASKAAVSAGERGYQYLCDWVAQNAARFQGGPLASEGRSLEVFGVLEADEVFIIRSVFQRTVSDAGFSPAALLSWLKQNELIRTRGRNRTLSKRINGVRTECVCLRLPREELDEEPELLP